MERWSGISTVHGHRTYGTGQGHHSQASFPIATSSSSGGRERCRIQGIRGSPSFSSQATQPSFRSSLNTPPRASGSTVSYFQRYHATPYATPLSYSSSTSTTCFTDRSPEGSNPRRKNNRKSPHKAVRKILSDETATSEQNPNHDDDIVVLRDKGKNRLFPHEPELSAEFKEYLQSLSNQDPEEIKALAHKPPIMLEKCPEVPKGISHCYITTKDLSNVQDEIDKITFGMSMDERLELPDNTDNATIQLLSLHEYLISHVLAAKERCIGSLIKKSGQEKLQTGGVSFTERQQMPNAGETEQVGHSLFWQAGVFRDMYRQTLMTPYMLEKRKRGLTTLKTDRKRAPTKVSQKSKVPRQKSSTSTSTEPNSKAKQ